MLEVEKKKKERRVAEQVADLELCISQITELGPPQRCWTAKFED